LRQRLIIHDFHGPEHGCVRGSSLLGRAQVYGSRTMGSRSFAYSLARLLGDVNAIHPGAWRNEMELPSPVLTPGYLKR
jgi:hypothetical protein